jgi:hypothetical protein
MDESTGQQLSIPLSELDFDANGKIDATGWPLYQAHQATVDSLLFYLQGTGALYPAPQPPPSPAMLIEAKQAGSNGNNIQVAFSKVGTSDPNDPKKFDAQVTETETYTGLTQNSIESTLGTPAKAGTAPPGLVAVTAGSAKGRPDNKTYTIPAGNKLSVLQADGATQAFELQARDVADAEAKYTTVTISGVNAADPTDPHFNLTVTWQKSANGIKSGDLQAQFEYEIKVSPPPGAAAVGIPGNGVVTLRGGAEVAAATTAKATVTGSS